MNNGLLILAVILLFLLLVLFLYSVGGKLDDCKNLKAMDQVYNNLTKEQKFEYIKKCDGYT